MYKVITGILKARTAVHIGSGLGNDLTDALLRRDAMGRPFIPGTSIAGALRALLTRLAPRLDLVACEVCQALTRQKRSCKCRVCQLFGDINPSDEPGAESAASRIAVYDAPLVGEDWATTIRDGVGIDRTTGTAARAGGVKFDLEVIPVGSRFELRIELCATEPEDEKLLAVGLGEWQAGRLWLGGRVARGLGAFELADLQYKTLELDTPEGLMRYLANDEPWKEAIPRPGWLDENLATAEIRPAPEEYPAVARSWFMVTGLLVAEGPVLSNDPLTAGMTGFDHAPLFATPSAWQRPVLSGAGLRGVLRSHAERLARTLATMQAADEEDYLIRCPACDPNVRDKVDGTGLPAESCDSLLKKEERRGQRNMNDDPTGSLCLACRLFGSPRLGSRLIVEDAPYRHEKEPPKGKMLDFLAIDRFTGGGADKLKFDALALWCPAFDFRLYLENLASWELGWLWLVLRDLEEGWLRVGSGGAKGFGRVKLLNREDKFGYLLPDDFPGPAGAHLPGQKKEGLYTVVEFSSLENGESLVKEWVDEFHRQVSSFSRPLERRWKEDIYFRYLKDIYPLETRGGVE